MGLGMGIRLEGWWRCYLCDRDCDLLDWGCFVVAVLGGDGFVW